MEPSIVTFKFTNQSRILRERRGNSLEINRSGAVSGLGHEPHVEGGEGGEHSRDIWRLARDRERRLQQRVKSAVTDTCGETRLPMPK